jgi:23S rRNA (adenine2503-C2)-methyltransferase
MTALAAPAAPPHLLACTAEALEHYAMTRGFAAARGRDLFTAVFARRMQDVSGLDAVPKALRRAVMADFATWRPRLLQRQVSQDGTRKYQLQSVDGAVFEAVYIPEVADTGKTNALCISSQSGCAVGCKFCFTASLKRHRDLSVAEIVGQVLQVRDDVAPLGRRAQVTNIVFMGMGEPLLNYDNVVAAARLLLDPRGVGISKRRMTVSTSGIVPRIYDLGRDLPVTLAISLNASSDAVRTQIMPINKKWPIATLLQALWDYPLPPRRRFTIEYVLLGGVNDSPEDAERLAALLRGLPVKINLLPLNPHDRTPYTPPSPERVAAFQEALWRAGYKALMRAPRGQDIAAACGQLGEVAGRAVGSPAP